LKNKMIVLIDIGNTNTHIGLSNGKKIIKRFEIQTARWFNDKSEYRNLFPQKIESAIIASVVPKSIPRVVSIIKSNYNFSPFILKYSNAPIKFNYPHPKTLGADRIANCIAALHIYGAPSIVVDFGTAVTIDIINADGLFEGGVILPGINLMTAYLSEKTALLPEVKLRNFKKPYGKNTEQAILAGLNTGFSGMIDTIIKTVMSEMNFKKPFIIATGSYAEKIAKQMRFFTHRDKNLTLMGLLVAYNNLKNLSEK